MVSASEEMPQLMYEEHSEERDCERKASEKRSWVPKQQPEGFQESVK
jgi:hypothetical protein